MLTLDTYCFMDYIYEHRLSDYILVVGSQQSLVSLIDRINHKKASFRNK